MHCKITQILRLYSHGIGIKSISRLLELSRNTVRRYVRQYQEMGKSMDELLKLDEEHLRELFSYGEEKLKEPSLREQKLQELIPSYALRLKGKKKVTKKDLYEDYVQRCDDPLSYSRFCRLISQYMNHEKVIAHVKHIPGDQMYIDFAGDKLSIVDSRTGEIIPCEIAVIILPASKMTYVEAVSSQSKEDLILACENALYYFGGAPAAFVPDNLKAAVVKADRVEPVIQEDFAAFAEHYECAVYPARVRHPQDKALVEDAVKLAYREIYPAVENREFHSLTTLNREIRKALEAFNDKKMSDRPYSRRERFLEVEKECLRPLPAKRYPMKKRKVLTVRRNSYFTLFQHNYSVPTKYIGKRVEVIYGDDTIEVYYNLRIVTTHQRDDTPYEYTTRESHKLPGHHGSYEEDIKAQFKKAAEIHDDVYQYLKLVEQDKKYPPQVFRSMRSILALGEKYGKERLTKACRIAMECGEYSYTQIQWMLRNGEDYDLMPEEEKEERPETHSKTHKNVRGADYYKSNNNKNLNNGNK